MAMGALQRQIRLPVSRPNMHASNNSTHQTTLVSPDSSFSSTSSCCLETVPKSSPPRLRRSTLDLSHLKSSGILLSLQRQDSVTTDVDDENLRKGTTGTTLSSTNTSHGEERSLAKSTTIVHYFFVLQTILLVETSIRIILGEAQNHLGNVFGFLLNSIIANNSKLRSEDLAPTADARRMEEEQYYDVPSLEPPLLTTSIRVTSTPTCNSSKDEWGHFADFQDELADETSFIPSSQFTKAASLETLEEYDGCEGDDEGLSF